MEHPGFAAVQKKIEGEGYSKKSAGAILAHASRSASKGAKKKNPHLARVHGATHVSDMHHGTHKGMHVSDRHHGEG
jgi:hypothetical protein